MVIDFIDWLLGRKERRLERDAYLAAINGVVESSKAQSEMFRQWFETMQSAQGEAQKGWTTGDREQYITEMERERPEVFIGMPPALRGDPVAMESWLNEEMLSR